MRIVVIGLHQTDCENNDQWVTKKCLSNGIHITNQRQIIIGAIENSEDHADVG